VRRLALIAAVIATGIAGIAATAGADDSHTYTIELDNAFGIVEGSEVRIAGVTAGQVTSLDINEDKRALLTVELSGPLSQLGDKTECSSEPQSLIAEYFIDCTPEGDPIPEEEEGSTTDPNIPVEQTIQNMTVQADLVQNTLREPYKRRLQLLINEFGTALAGNPENLNEAIRRGAPALRQLEEATDILGDQNRIIRDLNADSDKIMARLAERRDDVVEFIKEARDTAAASAERRADLAADFDLLDDFLAGLRPTMVELGNLAAEQTPLLVDLRASAPQLNELAVSLPAFNEASEVSVDSLGEAAVVGKKALRKGRDEIKQLRTASKKASPVAELLADFLRDLDDPDRHVQADARAAKETGRPMTTGYTGLEGLLNYVYYQAGSLNQYDPVSHLLHFSIFSVETPCQQFNTGGEPGTPEFGVPALNGGHTTNILEADRCVAWLGPSQPGISEDLNLPPYDNSVCPEGSNAPELCDPNVSTDSTAAGVERGGGGGGSAQGYAPPPATPGSPEAPSAPGLPDLPEGGGGAGGGGGGGLGDAPSIDDILGLPQTPNPGGGLGLGPDNGGGSQPADDLLDFLFSN
jgi:ABC-type transporter Mla subunit MlaD